MWFTSGPALLLLCIGIVHAFEDKTVFQYLVDNGYTSFVNLLKAANLDSQLNGVGPFTVFAPTDAAIAKLDPALLMSLGNNTLQLQQVLKYHVTIGFILIPQVNGHMNIVTMEGQTIVAQNEGVSLALNNATHVIAPDDIICNNGVVHTIDSVMLPPVFGTSNIASVLLINDNMFQDLFGFVLMADLLPLLESGEYTLFAPVDAAWAPFADNILHPRQPNRKDVFLEMLKYHVVPGARTSSMLKDGQHLYTLHSTAVNITKASDIMVNNAHVIKADIPATNGVIHAIDHVLFPRDLLRQLIQEYQASHHYSTTNPFTG